jgi:long-chain fatty acid transport protein
MLSFGVHYRSRYDLDFDDGAITFERVPPELSAVLHDSPATATLKIPDLISTGIGVRPVPRLFLQAQFDWSNWSRLQTLELKAQDPALNVTIPQRWSDGYALRFGAEYMFVPVSLRLGFGIDWTPAPAFTLNPIIPDANRYLVSGGLGFWLPRGFALEGSLMGVFFDGRTSTLPEFPVRYETWAVLAGLGISYHGRRNERLPTR